VMENEKAVLVAIFNKLADEISKDADYALMSKNEQMNILANNSLIYHSVKNVLYDLDDLLVKSEVAESVKPIFKQYYKRVIEGNVDAILSDPPCRQEFNSFPIEDKELRVAIYNYYEYMNDVRKTASDDTFAMMDKVSKHNVEGIANTMSDMYSFMQSRRFEVPLEDQQNKCAELCKHYKIADIYKSFQIVIMLFDVFPFVYNKFVKMIKYKINDPSIDDVDIQRRYLISTLAKKANYDDMKRSINHICNEYSSTMEKIEKEIKTEEDKIRGLYEGSDAEVDEYIESLIKK